MSRPDLFTDKAAQRHADAVNRGDLTPSEIWSDVRDWFASVYGWPLTEDQVEELTVFWRNVADRVEVRS